MTYTTNVQWKGTDLCMDFVCPDCGTQQHFEGYFAHVIRCRGCAVEFTLPTDLPLTRGNTRPEFWTALNPLEDDDEPTAKDDDE